MTGIASLSHYRDDKVSMRDSLTGKAVCAMLLRNHSCWLRLKLGRTLSNTFKFVCKLASELATFEMHSH